MSLWAKLRREWRQVRAIRSAINGVMNHDPLKDWPEALFPHCDSNVLHAPGKCVYCDRYPVQQAFRLNAGINFTGEKDPGKFQCPAERDRGIESIEAWRGNVPKPHDQETA